METRRGGRDAPEGLEREAGAAVQAHQARPQEAWTERGQGRGDRGTHREQGARAIRRGEDREPDVPEGHLVRTPRGPARQPEGSTRPNEGTAVRGSQAQGRRG